MEGVILYVAPQRSFGEVPALDEGPEAAAAARPADEGAEAAAAARPVPPVSGPKNRGGLVTQILDFFLDFALF